jgi:spore coat polysaccharide biosynthesis protein SpsF (cytidylyltransferase family)
MPVTVAAVIQARMTSTRLPGKVLLPAAGREMLAHQIDRVRRATRVDVVCIATTENEGRSTMSWTGSYAPPITSAPTSPCG